MVVNCLMLLKGHHLTVTSVSAEDFVKFCVSATLSLEFPHLVILVVNMHNLYPCRVFAH